MPKVLVIYVRCIESANTWLGKILAGAIFMLIAVLLIEAVSRYVFNSPTYWSHEMSGFIIGTYFVLGGGYVLLNGAHVGMDALSARWSRKKRAIVDLATFPLLATYLVVFLMGGISSAARAVRVGERTMTMWGPQLGPIKIILVVGVVMLLLQGIALLIRDVYIVKGKDLA